ncbi:MAG: S41 family peptidase [Ignavibacteria bacterium]
MIRFISVLTILIASYSLSFAQQELWMRYPAISPDGSMIAFAFQGDIWVIPAKGGKADRITNNDAYDVSPVWSPDGKSIAFGSDRHGNMDVFIMTYQGGNPRRLTYHSSGEIPSAFSHDGSSIYVSTHIQDSPKNSQFPSGGMGELYAISVKDGKRSQVLTTPAEEIAVDPKGNFLVYQDKRGGENYWRKHHTSSIARDIWMVNLKDKTHTPLIENPAEDREPIISADGNTCYFLSERSGTFNVWSFPINNPTNVKQLTSFTKHPIRFLSVDNQGVLCFNFHGGIYTFDTKVQGAQPVRISIDIINDSRRNDIAYKVMNQGATEMALSPSGKEVAFVIRGEIYVTAVDHEVTKRITNTPGQERSVSYSPDGKSLLYAGERNGSWNVYQTSLTRKNEPFFYRSTVLEEKAIVETSKDEFQPRYSPDGKEVAYLENRVVLKVKNLASNAVRLIVDSTYNYSYSDGDQWYEWSPDGKWFLISIIDKSRWVDEVGIIDAQGKGPIRNVTQSGYSDNQPKWAKNGKLFIYSSDKAGFRSHGSWGAESDVFGTFLTQDAYERFKLSKDEFELLKMREKDEELSFDEQRKKDSLEKERKKGNVSVEVSEPITIDFDRLEERTMRFTIHSSNLADYVLSPDGERLYYLSRFEKGYDIWVQKFRDKETKLLAKLGAGSGALEQSPDGRFLYVISDGKITRIDTSNGSQKAIAFKAEMDLNAPAERAYMFDHAWRQAREKFYVTDLHGVDWNFYRQAYEPFLTSIDNNYDFAELLSELLGELNASHTGSGYRAQYSDEIRDQTAVLGAFWDEQYQGPGLKIMEIIAKSPLDHPKKLYKVGMIIEKIDGMPISLENMDVMMNRRADKTVLISVYDPEKNKRFDESIKLISFGAQEELLYRRWVLNCRQMVDSLSKGKVGYVHVRGMNSESFREAYSEVLGRHADKVGIIIDTRFNGGGWLHDDLATLLSGKQYVKLVPRGQLIGSEPQNKWQRKSVVLMNESNYSDAHFFPWTYKQLNIGPLIGMPVPGTATAVWWETQIDPTIYFGIPQVGTIGNDGKYLENNQLEPDIKVMNLPEDYANGIDKQIRVAVEELLR